MSERPKKSHRRRNSLEFMDSVKPLGDQEDKEIAFFHDDSHNNPLYLELPIKIQHEKPPHFRPRLHQSSNESSEHVDVYSQTPQKMYMHMEGHRQNAKDEYEELMLNISHRQEDMDSLLLPEEPYNQFHNEINQYLMLSPRQIKEEYYENSREETVEIRKLENQYRSLLHLINNFRAFTQATAVAMNYHRLAKKDSLNKSHYHVFNLIVKESKKLQSILATEKLKFMHLIETEKKEHFTKEEKQSNDLVGTHAGTLPVRSQVKEEQRND